MKRFLLLIITVVLIVTIGIPYGVGLLLTDQYYEIIGQFNKNSSLEISGKFTTGVFKSTAKTFVKSKTINHDSAPLSLELTHIIHHGPVIIDFKRRQIRGYKLAIIETDVINKTLQEINDRFYKDQSGIAVINTELEYQGNGITKIKNFPVTMNFLDGQAEWGGIEATIKHNRLFTAINYTLSIPKLAYQEGENLIELQRLTTTGMQQLTPIGLWQGSVELQFKRLHLRDRVDDIFVISGFKCSSKIDIDNTNVNFNLVGFVESVFALASIDKTDPLTFNINIENIDGEALQLAQKLGYWVANDPIDTEQITEIWRKALLKKIKVIIKDTKFNLSQGNLMLEADLSIGGTPLPTIALPTIMQTTDGVVRIEIAKALAYELAAKKIARDIALEAKNFELSHEGNNMPQPYQLTPEGRKEEIEKRLLVEIKKLIVQKLIIERDKTFYTEIDMKNGIITINGKPL